MPVLKLTAPRLNPNAQWLLYAPGTFNALLHDSEIPIDIRHEVQANNGSQFFEVDVSAKPFKWGRSTAQPDNWPSPVASYFSKAAQHAAAEAQAAEAAKDVTPPPNVLIGTKMP